MREEGKSAVGGRRDTPRVFLDLSLPPPPPQPKLLSYTCGAKERLPPLLQTDQGLAV